MTQVDEQLIQDVVTKVLEHVQSGWGGRVAPTVGKSAAAPVSTASATPTTAGNRFGQFTDVDEAVAAAKTAQAALMRRSLAQRPAPVAAPPSPPARA